jgi:hypothetical protein
LFPDLSAVHAPAQVIAASRTKGLKPRSQRADPLSFEHISTPQAPRAAGEVPTKKKRFVPQVTQHVQPTTEPEAPQVKTQQPKDSMNEREFAEARQQRRDAFLKRVEEANRAEPAAPVRTPENEHHTGHESAKRERQRGSARNDAVDNLVERELRLKQQEVDLAEIERKAAEGRAAKAARQQKKSGVRRRETQPEKPERAASPSQPAVEKASIPGENNRRRQTTKQADATVTKTSPFKAMALFAGFIVLLAIAAALGRS